MINELKISLEKFQQKAKQKNQVGSNLTISQVNQLQEIIGYELPDWYVEMMKNYSIIGIDFEVQEYEDDDLKSGIEISNFETIVSETNEAYPGILVKELGYLNFGECLLGSGDPIFINLKENENPPVIRIYHDGMIKNERIDKDGGHILSRSVSDFFDKAIF